MSNRNVRIAGALLLIAAAALVFIILKGPMHRSPQTSVLYGVNVHPEQPVRNNLRTSAYNPSVYKPVLDRLRAAGTAVVRLQVPWVWLEPTKGVYDKGFLRKVDDFVGAVTARGMRVLMTTGGPPCWATSHPGAACGPGYLRTAGAAYPPRRASDVSSYAAFIARRWRNQLAGIEVLNEPDHPQAQFFQVPVGTQPAAAYVRIVKATYRGVKRVAPNVPVIAGALAFSDGPFLRQMYADGVKRYSDAISIHPYNVDFADQVNPWGNPTRPFPNDRKASFATGVPWIHRIMAANGDGAKPLWLTEFGFPACNPSALCLDEATQAQDLSRSFQLIRHWPYVKAAFVHEAYSPSTDRDLWVDGFGLLRPDLSRRPAYCAFARAAGAGQCIPDPLPPELQVQQDLIRAWQVAKAYYTAHDNSFQGFDGQALRAADSAFSAFELRARNVTPSAAAVPARIGISASATRLELCNTSQTAAYCVVETTAAGGATVADGKSLLGTDSAASATAEGRSTYW